MSSKIWVGWDVGGAHLKMVAVESGGKVEHALQMPCPLWRGLHELESAVNRALAYLDTHRASHVITMTGELADCFQNRTEGVKSIADTMAPKLGGDIRFFAIDKPHFSLVQPSEVVNRVRDIASANWYASASFLASRFRNGILLDIGSTTTDICPFLNGMPLPNGYDDYGRMCSKNLIYTGVVRTPVMAIAHELVFEGIGLGVAAEYFATTADIYRLTGELEPEHDMAETADGRDKSLESSAARLARMVGADASDAELVHWCKLAEAFKLIQLKRIVAAVSQCCSTFSLPTDAPIIGVGAGSFLARQVAKELERTFVEASEMCSSQSKIFEAQIALAFPAFALANLASGYGHRD